MSNVKDQSADYQLADLSPVLKTSDSDNKLLESLPVWLSAQTRKSAGRGRRADNTLQYGVQKLRELILELAVRGKLVSQDPNDEPASTLLEKIAEKKSLLVERGKIKKQKEQLEVSESDKPFELPRGWTFERFINILDFSGGGQPPKHTFSEICLEGYVQLIQIRDLGPNPQPVYIPKEKASKFCTENDVMVGRYGASVGKVFRGKNGAYNVALIKLHNDYEVYTQDFLYLVMSSPLGQSFFNGMSRSAQAGFSKDDIASKILPVVPLAEQHRIVKKVDELMALCDQLEQQQADAVQAHDTLVKVLLDSLTQSENAEDFQQNWRRIAEHFDTLFTTEASIDQLKQTLLQLAVMGKLVPQDPSDVPASTLVKKMASTRDKWLKDNANDDPECRTMLRKLAKLPHAVPPFNLPKTWTTSHLIELSQIMVDCHNKTAPYTPSGIPIIRTSNVRERQFRLDDIKYVNEETYAYWSRRCPPLSGDIIFTREAPMGEAAIIPPNQKFCLGQRTMLIRTVPDFVSNDYLLLALTEPHLLERASQHAIGSTVKHLRVGDVEALNIPVPPLAEQHRIVQKIDQLVALCDRLKDRLNQGQTLQQQLADTLVEQVL